MDALQDAPEPPRPEALALEYLERRSEGADDELEPWLARLPDEESRREFRLLVAASQRIERALPQAPRALSRDQLVAGRYLLVRQLGVGGMGQVWEALDRDLNRHVALKFLDSASQGRPEREDMFQKESRLLASLQHPGIVAVHEFGRDGDLAFIVMDLVHGRSLSEVLDEVRGQFLASGEQPLPSDARQLELAIRNPLPKGRVNLCEGGDWFRSVARIELELARTIEAAHGAKVVHRDLKPSNVMLTGGANPVVLDFGLAGSSEGMKGAVTQGLYGSVAYLAPEQAKSQTVGSDPRTDIYQLGLVLYEMLTLQRTFPGNAIGDVLERIQQGRFPVPRKVHGLVPRELQAICLRAIELDPARRYQTARELREDLDRWLTGSELPHAVHGGRMRRGFRRVRWHVRQRPWVSAAAGLVLAGTAGVWYRNANPRLDLALRDVTPVRYDTQTHKRINLDEDEKVVHKDDYLGFSFTSNKDVHVWALSVYGPAGEPDRVTPYRAVTPDDLARDGEFGLQLPAGENVVLGPQMEAEPNPSEGLMLFVADAEQPFMEDWFREMKAGQGETGMSWARAKELGIQALSVSRGAGHNTRVLTPEERELLRAAFRKASDAKGQIRMDLPDIQTLQVQCASR